METFVATLFGLFFTYQNALIMLGTWGLIEAIIRAFPQLMRPPIVRALPLVTLVFCSAAVWIPGAVDTVMPPAIRVFLGLNLGAWSGYLYKVWKQTILGKDARLADLIPSVPGDTLVPPADPVPPVAPVPPVVKP